MHRILQWMFRTQYLLYVRNILVSPSDQDIARTVVGADCVRHTFSVGPRAIVINRETEVLSERKDSHISSSMSTVYSMLRVSLLSSGGTISGTE